MHRLWLFNAPPAAVLRRLPLCVAWSSALAAWLVASRWCSATAPLLAASCSVASPGQQQLSHHGAPASNKPHSAEKSTPAWLAIWRTWAGFANSQLRRATFRSNYSYQCPSPLLPSWNSCSDRRKSFDPSAPIAYATSVSPPNEAIAWLGAQVLGAG